MTLSDPVFRSKLRDDLEAFISQKRASGYPYHTSSKVLGYLDTMIAEDYPDCSTLSKEICVRGKVILQPQGKEFFT